MGQGTVTGSERYNWFDGTIGIENTALYEGLVYVEKYRTVNDRTKFLDSPDFLPGAVTYYGQPYYGLELKYNVHDDQLLLRAVDKVGGGTIQLFKEGVTGFQLGKRTFTRLDNNMSVVLGVTGYFEVKMKNGFFDYYTKHQKKVFKRKDRNLLYHEFVDDKQVHLLFYNDKFHRLNGKKDLVTIFPDLQTEIDAFYRVAKSLRNEDYDGFMLSLMNRVQLELENKTIKQ